MRPIPRFSGYRIPDISNVYVCGSANHPGPGVSMAPGRNAAQVIYADLGLDFKTNQQFNSACYNHLYNLSKSSAFEAISLYVLYKAKKLKDKQLINMKLQ